MSGNNITPQPDESLVGAGCEQTVDLAGDASVCVINCVDAAGNKVPLEVNVAGFSFTGDVNISPDGPVSTPICIDGVDGVLFGQCEDGVGDWKAHSLGDGTVVVGLPAGVWTFGACVIDQVGHTTVTECRNDTIHTVTRKILADDTIVEIEAVDSGVPCAPAGCDLVESKQCVEHANGEIGCVDVREYFPVPAGSCTPDLNTPEATWANIDDAWVLDPVFVDCPDVADMGRTIKLCLNGVPYKLEYLADSGDILTYQNLDTGLSSIFAGKWPAGASSLADFESCRPEAMTIVPTGATVDYKHRCMVDDIDGNPINWVTYQDWVRVEVDADGVRTETILGTFTDCTNSTVYAPVGVSQVSCCDAADAGLEIRAVASGASNIAGGVTYAPVASAPGAWLISFTAKAVGADVPGVDALGNPFIVRAGTAPTWETEYPLPLQPPFFTVPAGAELDVLWTETVPS